MTHDGPDRNVDRLIELGAFPAGNAQLGTQRPALARELRNLLGWVGANFARNPTLNAASHRQIRLSGGTRREPGRSYLERPSRSPSAVVGKRGWNGPYCSGLTGLP